MSTTPTAQPVTEAAKTVVEPAKPATKQTVTNTNKKTGVKTVTEIDATTGTKNITTTDSTGKQTVETVTLPERVTALETNHQSLLVKLRKKLAFFDK
jgi:hypothetical protein